MHLQRCRENGVAADEFEVIRKDNTLIYCSVESVRLSEDRTLGFVADITNRKLTEQRLIRLARTEAELATATVNACRALEGKPPRTLAELVAAGTIEYIPFPEALKGKYQSFTQADLGQLRATGYVGEFATVEQGVADYVKWLAR